MQKTKVLFAYCHELDRCVSVDEARTAFFSRKLEDRKRFTFSCSDRHCKVTISGVNYHVKAEDGQKFRAAHFRSLHSHQPGCEWTQFTEDIEQARRPDESEQEFVERKARQKLTDFINCFDPVTEESAPETTNAAPRSDCDSTDGPAARSGGERHADEPRWSRYTRTNQLQRLIDTWQEAKEKLSPDEYRSLRLRLLHREQVFLHRYITHINSGLSNEYGGVIYGGGTLVQRYGRGFLIHFYDKVDDKAVRLYVSKDVMAQGRTGHYVDEILNTPNVRYFRVFLLAPAVSEKKNRAGQTVINLEILTLRQLAIYYELNSSTDDVPVSTGNDGNSPA